MGEGPEILLVANEVSINEKTKGWNKVLVPLYAKPPSFPRVGLSGIDGGAQAKLQAMYRPKQAIKERRPASIAVFT